MTTETLGEVQPGQGFVKLYRSLLEHRFWIDLPLAHRVVAITLLGMAGYKPAHLRSGLTLAPGQLVTSHEDIARRIRGGITRHIVRRALARLAEVGFLQVSRVTQSPRKLGATVAQTARASWRNRGIVVTIVNWADFQTNGEASGRNVGANSAQPTNIFDNKTPNKQEVKKIRNNYGEGSFQCKDPRRLSLREALDIFRGIYRTAPTPDQTDLLDRARSRYTPTVYFRGLKSFFAETPSALALEEALEKHPERVFGGGDAS